MYLQSLSCSAITPPEIYCLLQSHQCLVLHEHAIKLFMRKYLKLILSSVMSNSPLHYQLNSSPIHGTISPLNGFLWNFVQWKWSYAAQDWTLQTNETMSVICIWNRILHKYLNSMKVFLHLNKDFNINL